MKYSTFSDLLVFVTKANLRTEVSRYYLNYLWWVITPLSSMSVFYLVFGIFLNSGTPDYVAFLLCGITFWQWFSNTINNSSGSIYGNVGLMTQVDIPKIFFPLEVLLRDSFKHLFVLFLLLFFLIFYPTPVGMHWVALPLLLAIQFILNAGFAMLSAAVVPMVPDLRFVISTFLDLAFFGSGVIYSIEQVVLPKHQFILYLNPIAGLIKCYRDILIYARWPDWQYLLYVASGSILLFVFSSWIIFKFDRIYPRICQK